HGDRNAKMDLSERLRLKAAMTLVDPSNEQREPGGRAKSGANGKGGVDIKANAERAPAAPESGDDDPLRHGHDVRGVEQDAENKRPEQTALWHVHLFHRDALDRFTGRVGAAFFIAGFKAVFRAKLTNAKK